MTADYFALITHDFDTRSNFHSLSRFAGLFNPICNSSFCRIVRRHFHFHSVSGHNADKIEPHLAGQMTKNYMTIGQLDTK